MPLSLLLESLLQLGGELIDDGGSPFVATGARRVKMSRFVEPANSLVVKLRLAEHEAGTALVKFRCEIDGGRVCVGEAWYSRAVGDDR